LVPNQGPEVRGEDDSRNQRSRGTLRERKCRKGLKDRKSRKFGGGPLKMNRGTAEKKKVNQKKIQVTGAGGGAKKEGVHGGEKKVQSKSQARRGGGIRVQEIRKSTVQ